MKKITIITIIAAVVCSVSVAYSGHIGRVIAEKIICSSFKTQAEAQAAYNADPVKYADLDRIERVGPEKGKKDGKVCESLPDHKR